jgi:CubicO group peptidase (beta-lactamase class C family)
VRTTSLLAALFAAPLLSAQQLPEAGESTRPAPLHPAAIEASLDSLLQKRMAEYHLPGLAVVAVRDGEVFLLKGYGYADREAGRPVDPRTTLFRIASVSKPITATAVMQLSERGELDLHTELGRFLSAPRLDVPGAEPLTMEHLLTHTAALDEQALQRATRDPARVLSLEQWLGAHPPRRIGAPGRLISYNDVGITLAGRVVEAISGLSFPDYTEQRIFHPLGMHRTTFAQDLPDSLRAALAIGYDFRRGAYHRVGYDYVHQTPPAGMMTTAADMARFLIAHLEGGAYGAARILQEATVQEMHARHFVMDPRLYGTAYGLWEIPARGQRGLWHGGDWNGYGAVLFLLPEERAGIFAAFNGRSDELKYELMSWFASQMIATRPPRAAPTPASERTDLELLSGTYRFTRYARSSMAALPTILSGQAPEERVVRNGDGTLTIFGQRWVEVEQLFFRRADGNGPSLIFIRDAAGRPTHLVLNGFETFERVPWHRTVRFHLAVLGACLLGFVAVLTSEFRRRVRRRMTAAPESRPARFARAALTSVAAIGALSLVSIGGTMTLINPLDFMAEIPAWTLVLLCVPLVVAALTAVLPLFAAYAWLSREWPLGEWIAYSAGAIVAVAFVWVLATWNLIGFHF